MSIGFQKDIPWESREYLDFVASHSCICGNDDGTVVAAHYGRHGISSKASDVQTCPECHHCHSEEHAGRPQFTDEEKMARSLELINEWMVKNGRK